MIRNLTGSMKWSAEQAMTAMQISDEDKTILLKKFSTHRLTVLTKRAIVILSLEQTKRKSCIEKRWRGGRDYEFDEIYPEVHAGSRAV